MLFCNCGLIFVSHPHHKTSCLPSFAFNRGVDRGGGFLSLLREVSESEWIPMIHGFCFCSLLKTLWFLLRVEFHLLALQVLNSAILVVFSVSVRFLQLVCLWAFMEFLDSQSYFMSDDSHCLRIQFFFLHFTTSPAAFLVKLHSFHLFFVVRCKGSNKHLLSNIYIESKNSLFKCWGFNSVVIDNDLFYRYWYSGSVTPFAACMYFL